MDGGSLTREPSAWERLVDLLREVGAEVCFCVVCKHQPGRGCSVCWCRNGAPGKLLPVHLL